MALIALIDEDRATRMFLVIFWGRLLRCLMTPSAARPVMVVAFELKEIMANRVIDKRMSSDDGWCTGTGSSVCVGRGKKERKVSHEKNITLLFHIEKVL